MAKQRAVMFPEPCKNECDLANTIEKWMDDMKTLENTLQTQD